MSLVFLLSFVVLLFFVMLLLMMVLFSVGFLLGGRNVLCHFLEGLVA
jgi:hypothetical protein